VDKKGFFQHNIIKKRKKLGSKVGRNYDCDISRNQNRERKKQNKQNRNRSMDNYFFVSVHAVY